MVEAVDLERVLTGALSAVVLRLKEDPRPHLVEADLKKHLREALSEVLPDSGGLRLSEGELPAELRGWPRIGHIDLAIELEDSLPVLFELKYGADSLWNCAYDLPKMALAAREARGSRTFLLVAGPSSTWPHQEQGPDILSSGDLDTRAFFEQHRNLYRGWQRNGDRLPVCLPDRIGRKVIAELSFGRAEEPHELRCVEVTAPGAGWVEFDLVPKPVATEGEPERIDRPEIDRDPATQLVAGEGESIFLFGPTDVISSGFIEAEGEPDDPLPGPSTLRFPSSADRESYLRKRGWLDFPRPKPWEPSAFAFRWAEGMGVGSDFLIHFRVPHVVLEVSGREQSRRRPQADEWALFWRQVELVDPWEWADTYQPLRMATDLPGWQLLLAYNDRLAFSSGYGVFPEAKGGLFRLMEAAGHYLLDSADLPWGRSDAS